MISSMASISSSSSAAVCVEKATSEFLIGPDWTLNIDICDSINSNQTLAKDVVKAVKKRLQHKNAKVQLLALTLLETMVKNCGDYVHFQIAEKNILPEMVKIVKKKTDMNVRDKILVLIGSWHQAFGGAGGRYSQYYMAYEDLRRSGVDFPRNLPGDAVPIFTPPVTHPITRNPQPGYGMPSSSSTRLDEAMAAEENLSLPSLNSMQDVLDLLADMLQAVDPNDRSAVKDEVIVDLVEQCRANQKKLVQLLATTGDEEILGKGLELNDSLQIVLAKHDAIASGSPLPPEVRNITSGGSEKRDSSSAKPAETSVQNAPSTHKQSAPVLPAEKGVAVEEDDEEEDDFALLARRHSKARVDVSNSTSMVKADVAHPEAPSSPATSNALVPVDVPTSVRSKDQDMIDLLSITLSTPTLADQTPQPPSPSMQTPGNIPSAYPINHGLGFNNYVAPWAQPQPQPQPHQHQYQQLQSQPQIEPQQSQPQYQYPTQQQAFNTPHQQPQFPQYTSMYPPPPWAATPGYYTSNQSPVLRPAYTYPPTRPTFESNNGGTHVNSGLTSPVAPNVGPRPFIPTYRLFEDLNVLGNADGRFKATGNVSPRSSNQNMVGGRK